MDKVVIMLDKEYVDKLITMLIDVDEKDKADADMFQNLLTKRTEEALKMEKRLEDKEHLIEMLEAANLKLEDECDQYKDTVAKMKEQMDKLHEKEG